MYGTLYIYHKKLKMFTWRINAWCWLDLSIITGYRRDKCCIQYQQYDRSICWGGFCFKEDWFSRNFDSNCICIFYGYQHTPGCFVSQHLWWLESQRRQTYNSLPHHFKKYVCRKGHLRDSGISQKWLFCL